MSSLTLGYWSVRGLAEGIRYLLHHVEAEFEDKRFNMIVNSAYSREEWLKEKYTLGLDFPNLPYLVDGDVKISQSVAILRRLARKYSLAGKNEEEYTQLDLLEQEANDLEMGLILLAYNPAYETLVQPYLEKLPEKFEQFSKYLGEREWFVGDSVTYVDFLLYEALDHNRLFALDIFNRFDNLKRFLSRVEALPNISKYMKSDSYVKWPIFGPLTLFGGKGEMPQ